MRYTEHIEAENIYMNDGNEFLLQIRTNQEWSSTCRQMKLDYRQSNAQQIVQNRQTSNAREQTVVGSELFSMLY